MHKVIDTETGCDIVVFAPGYDKDEIKIKKSHNYIVVEGSSESPYVEDNSLFFSFEVHDNFDVDPEFKNGALIIHIKTRETQPETITIR